MWLLCGKWEKTVAQKTRPTLVENWASDKPSDKQVFSVYSGHMTMLLDKFELTARLREKLEQY